MPRGQWGGATEHRPDERGEYKRWGPEAPSSIRLGHAAPCCDCAADGYRGIDASCGRAYAAGFRRQVATVGFNQLRRVLEDYWYVRRVTERDQLIEGVGWLVRKLGTAATPVLTITVNDQHWSMLSESTFKTHNTEFDLGKEYEETTPDGRVMKACTRPWL